jgi:hypothetical protein
MHAFPNGDKSSFQALKFPSKFTKNLKTLFIPYFGYEAILKVLPNYFGFFPQIKIGDMVDMVYHIISIKKNLFY